MLKRILPSVIAGSGGCLGFTRSPRRRGREGGWDREAKSPGGFKIDRHLVLGWRLHRQVGRFLALEDAIHVGGRAAVLVDKIRPIGDQAAADDEQALVVHSGQFVPGRKRNDQITMYRRRRAGGYDQAAV